MLVAGCTGSSELPVSPDNVQSSNAGNNDLFIVALDGNGARGFATYYGGTGIDCAQGIVVDRQGAISVTGFTSSVDFPVDNEALQPTFGGGEADAFIARLGSKPAPVSVPVDRVLPRSLLTALMPVPATSQLHVSFTLDHPDRISMTVYAADGERILRSIEGKPYQAGDHQESIDVSALPAGSYLLELRTVDGRSVGRFTVVR
jgi:hypothetical protein